MIGNLRPSGVPPTSGRFFLAASAGLCEGVFQDQREARRGRTRKPCDDQSRKRGIKAQTHGHATATRKGVQVWGLTPMGVSGKGSVMVRNSRYQSLPPLTFFRIHAHSFPFFTRELTGNSTGKGGYSHE